MDKKNVEYCTCGNEDGVYCRTNDWGRWEMCVKCDRPVEDSFYYHNELDQGELER